MTARTITIPAPEWREVALSLHAFQIGGITIASVGPTGDPRLNGIWWANISEETSWHRFPDLPSAKAWAEQRALKLLGVKG